MIGPFVTFVSFVAYLLPRIPLRRRRERDYN
jgi:hypothetical protein